MDVGGVKVYQCTSNFNTHTQPSAQMPLYDMIVPHCHSSTLVSCLISAILSRNGRELSVQFSFLSAGIRSLYCLTN